MSSIAWVDMWGGRDRRNGKEKGVGGKQTGGVLPGTASSSQTRERKGNLHGRN